MMRPPEAFIRAEIAYRQERAVAAASKVWRKREGDPGRRVSRRRFGAPSTTYEQ
jgi:hypothetical protein